jgi:ABC-type Na+ transport system ATPase subunit NatA
VLFLHQGKIIAEGSSEAILSHFGQETLEEVFIAIARNQVTTSLLSGEHN